MAQNKIKAQITSQIFMFILAAIIFALIILYGYQAITKFLTTSNQVALTDFQNEFTNNVQSIKTDYGSVSKLELTLPKTYTQLCIIDSDLTKNPVNFQNNHPRMYSAWRNGAENIFITPPAQPILIKDITVNVNGGYFCINNTMGTITLRLEGQGDKTLVSQWSE